MADINRLTDEWRLIIMNELTLFENPEFGSVRVMVDENGEPWFVGKDVADMLGYNNPRDALSKHVDAEDKNTVAIHDGIPGNPNQVVINESGLYSLILSSKLPEAKQIKRWVTSEVLPSIRKHGMYATPSTIQDIINNPENAIALLTKIVEERKAKEAAEKKVEALTVENAIKNQQIAEMTPKVTYYDIVLQCKDAIPITVIAKDYGMSPQKMNKLLHEKHIQYQPKEAASGCCIRSMHLQDILSQRQPTSTIRTITLMTRFIPTGHRRAACLSTIR